MLLFKVLKCVYYVCAVSVLAQISNVLLNSTELKVPSSISPGRLAELAHLLPLLGVTFLQALTPSQLLEALPALNSVSFSPAQVEEHK